MPGETSPEWRTSDGLVDYDDAVRTMQQRVEDIATGKAPEMVWLLEHPPIITAGTSASSDELLNSGGNFPFQVYQTGRGGRYTYHGPGQRVAYVMLNLRTRDNDIRAHIWRLEEWVIRSLADFGVMAERREGRIGLWVKTDETEAKIGAIGVRVTRGVTWHGVAINIHPNLSHFNTIIPCGIREFGVTSLQQWGLPVRMEEFDYALKKNWPVVFDVPAA